MAILWPCLWILVGSVWLAAVVGAGGSERNREAGWTVLGVGILLAFVMFAVGHLIRAAVR